MAETYPKKMVVDNHIRNGSKYMLCVTLSIENLLLKMHKHVLPAQMKIMLFVFGYLGSCHVQQ